MIPGVLASAKDRYRIEREYARGGMGVTYLAVSDQTGERCILKQLRLETVSDWKVVELFQREAEMLRQLKHPNIPSYIDYFISGQDRHFNLVQTFIEGRTMQEWIDNRQSVTVEQFSDYIRQALDILEYLHSLVPPVIHRDITPKNMILQNEKLFLVDFGSVKDAVNPRSARGSTVVGTFGYMPPEQFLGHAEPASDLYSLGMSFVAFASHKDPFQMVNPELGRVEITNELDALPYHVRSLLLNMTDPSLPDRIKSASEAKRRLLHPELHGTPADSPRFSSEDQAEMNQSRSALLILVLLFLVAGLIAVVYTIRINDSAKEVAVYVPPSADLEIRETAAVRGFAASSRQNRLAVATTDYLIIRDADKGNVIRKINYDTIKTVTLKTDMFTGVKIFFTADDHRLVMIGMFSGKAFWWNTSDWQLSSVSGLPAGDLLDVKPSADQSFSAVIFHEKSSRLSVIRCSEKKYTTLHQLKLDNVHLCVLDSGPDKIAYTVKDDSVITVFDLAKKEKTKTFFSKGHVKLLQTDHRGEFIFWSSDRDWNIYKVNTGGPVMTGESGNSPSGLTAGIDMLLSPDGQWFAYFEKSYYRSELRVYSMASRTSVQTFYPDHPGMAMVIFYGNVMMFIPGQQRIAVSDQDKISFWNFNKQTDK